MSALDKKTKELVEEIELLRATISNMEQKELRSKKVEQALLESEERFRSIFENATIGMYRSTLEGQILLANPALIKMLGYTSFRELSSRNLEEQGYEPSYKRIDFINHMEKFGNIIGLEAIWIKKNGERIYVRESAVAYRNDQNKIEYFEGTVEDITQFTNTVEALRDSEEKYRLLFENMLNGLILFEVIKDKKGKPIDGKYLDINKSAEEIFNFKKKNVIGKTQKEVKGFIDPLLIKKLEKVITKDKASYFEYASKKMDKILEIYAYVPQKGQVACIINDITPRKKVEQELLFEKSLLETFMDNTVDHIYFKDLNSKFIRVNKAWAESRAPHLDGNPHKVIGHSDVNFFPEEIAKQTKADEEKIIETGNPIIQKLEIRPPCPQGKEFLSTTKMPLYNKDQEIFGTFGISRDITKQVKYEKELKKSEKELRELNATKDRFFSIIAHDLKNPFGSIINFSNLLLNNCDKYDKKRLIQYLSAIYETSKHGYNLLENLLEWSRSQTGKIIYIPQKINVYSLIDANLQLVELSASKKELKINNTISNDVIAYADPNMISTVIRNLLSNAVKFTERKGSIDISHKMEKKEVEIIVKDTGIGIPKRDVKKLFKIDEDFSTRGTDDEKGTGLGLIISSEFVKKNKGTLKVKSEEGKGSTFSFTLPTSY